VSLLFCTALLAVLVTACAKGTPDQDPQPAPEVETPSPAAAPEAPEAEDPSPGDMIDAETFLGARLAEAARTDRLVFLHSGAEWCGWCKRLEAWLERKDIKPIFSKDYVDVLIMEEMDGGPELINAYKGDRQGGFPWMAILNPEGEILITSNAPDGRNIGSPINQWEIEHWKTMIRETAKRITPEEIEHMAVTLAEDRKAP
jgi:hypothetical protein